jgi:acetoacetate decarboxylase
VIPEPLEVVEPIVKYEFIRMPDSTGFGDYTESGQVIPVRFRGEEGAYVHSMYLDDDAAIVGGRELWGFPKKLAEPKITHEGEGRSLLPPERSLASHPPGCNDCVTQRSVESGTPEFLTEAIS